MNVFKELYQNRKLIWKLSKNDFRNKFAGAYFGIVWAFIQPMVPVLIKFFEYVHKCFLLLISLIP